jgi:hypothetical protein
MNEMVGGTARKSLRDNLVAFHVEAKDVTRIEERRIFVVPVEGNEIFSNPGALVKDMYFGALVNGYLQMLYQVDHFYTVDPAPIRDGGYVPAKMSDQELIRRYVQDYMQELEGAYLLFTFYPRGRDIIMASRKRVVLGDDEREPFFLSMREILDEEQIVLFPLGLEGNEKEKGRSRGSENSYQQEVDFLLEFHSDSEREKVDRPESRSAYSLSMVHAFVRDPNRGKNAIVAAEYRCEADPSHKLFLSVSTGRNYVEGHHLIPMNAQPDFEFSLDVEANIVSLCVVCHKRLHHGRFEDLASLVVKLYEHRQERLVRCGIPIELESLLNYYR